MVGLTQLVNDSLLRHGVPTRLDPRRLHWSQWIPCHNVLSLAVVPSQPGLFALAEEVAGVGEVPAAGAKRMLALFEISETGDLGKALGRLFLPGSPEGKMLAAKRCFARYTVIEDDAQRASAYAVFKRWMASSAETAQGFNAPSDASVGSSNNKDGPLEPVEPLAVGF